jgi:hypothetical protein
LHLYFSLRARIHNFRLRGHNHCNALRANCGHAFAP